MFPNKSIEQLNEEIRRRTDVVGILPDRASIRAPRRSVARRAARRVGSRPPLPVESVAKALSPPADESEEVMAIPQAAQKVRRG